MCGFARLVCLTVCAVRSCAMFFVCVVTIYVPGVWCVSCDSRFTLSVLCVCSALCSCVTVHVFCACAWLCW